jgi:hypothetical protein
MRLRITLGRHSTVGGIVMVSKLLARLSYANVAATLALFFALGGTAYAAATIGSADIVNNSIRSKDIHNGTIAAKDLQPGIRVPKLFGNFNGDNGNRVRGRGIASSERMGLGFYVVHFKRNISECVVLSSIASIDSVNPDSATIGTGIWDNRGVFVLIRNDFADTREDADFSLSAFC